MKDVSRIGVFDSGLGGLTVLSALLEKLPHSSFLYLGDTARTPYGPKSPEVVIRYSLECAQFLEEKGIDLLVVACNTASSVALDAIASAVKCPVVGTIEPAIHAWSQSGNVGPLGVIGTRATILSAAYQQRLQQRFGNVAVLAMPCPLFVPLVEEGLTEGALVDQVIAHYLGGMRAEGVGSIILACTHYPLLRKAIATFFGQSVQIIDSADAIAETVASSYHVHSTGKPSRQFFVTDDVTRFETLAARFLTAPWHYDGPIAATHIEIGS